MNGGVAELAGRLRGLSARRSGLAVCLCGEAGIGKTFTARALLRETPCRNLSAAASMPTALLAAALPEPDRWPAWAERAVRRLRNGEEMTPEQAGAALLGQLTALTPFVLYLEDLHEADAARLDLVQFLAHGARRTRGLGLLLSSRAQPPGELDTVSLDHLTVEASRALLEEKAGAALPEEATHWIQGHAAGNPLFTLEYFRFLTRQGALWNDGRRWHWRAPISRALPSTVEALIELALLGAANTPALQATLAAGALLGANKPPELWARVAGDPAAFEGARAELTRRGVLLRGDFVHPLYREVAPRLLPVRVLMAASRRALIALGDEPLAASRLLGWAGLSGVQTLKWLARAAGRAEAAGRPVEAARLWARASEHALEAQAAELALRAALALREVDVVEAARLAGRAAHNPAQLGAATWLEAELLAAQCRVGEAERLLTRLPENARGGRAWFGRLLYLRGSGQDHAGVLDLLRQHPEWQGDLKPEAARYAAWSLAQSGRAGEADALLAQLTARASQDAGTRLHLLKAASLVAYARADFARMEVLEREVLELARTAGQLRLVDAALYNRALALDYLERYRERLECLEAALQVCLELGDPIAYVIAQVAYAGTLCEFGEYERAEELLHEAHAGLERADATVYLVDCECELSNLYQAWRPPHGALLALRHAHAAVTQARQIGNGRTLSQALHYAASAELWAGSPELAGECAGEALDLAAEVNLPLTWIPAHLARGRVLAAQGRAEEAREALRTAETLAQDVGAAVTAHRIGLELARLDGDLAKAREHSAWFAGHGLHNGVNAAKRAFPELTDTQTTSTPSASLDVLGPMRLRRGEQLTPVRGHKRQELLALLLEARLAGHEGVPAWQLCETLYAQQQGHEALGALKATVFKVRAGLGSDLIVTVGGGYALGPVGSDAELFLKGGDTHLWRGPYLEGVTGDHDGVARLLRALHGCAQSLLNKEPAETLRLAHLLRAADPLDAGLLELACHALNALGEDKALEKLYREARRDFAEVGETLPEGWQDFLTAHPQTERRKVDRRVTPPPPP